MNDQSETRDEFEKNVDWLAKSVSPEYIYSLAWQMVLNANFFLDKLTEWINIEEEVSRDGDMYRKVKSMVQLEIMRKFDTDEFMREFLRGKSNS